MENEYEAQLKAWKVRTAKILRAYRRKVPKAEIARQFGVSRQRIQAIIKEHGEKK